MQILIGWVVVRAQELKFRVAEFYQDQQDLSGQEENRDDGDGFLYAVIKVTSDNEDDDLNDFSFDFNFMKSSKEMYDGELWLFVQRNAKSVTIRREGYSTLKYSLPTTIQAGKTYRMKLCMQQSIVHQRILQFMVNPANEIAIVKVKKEDSSDDYQLWGTVDAQGSICRLLETGEYLYEISADGHKTSVGKVTLSNGSGNYIENVSLTPIRSLEGSSNYIEKKSPAPGFGFLEISDDYGIAGAEVYINNRKVGTIPYKSGRMKCRNDYQLMISNGELYKTYYSTIEIHKGDTTKISPRLQSNFAEITIKVQDDAEILINGISKGKGCWTGPLRAGIHDVECRLPNHVSSQKQIVVKPDVAETHILEKPTRIEGSIYVKSYPSGAKILLDGKDLGVVTPSKINNVLIGSHKVTLMFDNNPNNIDINVSKDNTYTINMDLGGCKFCTVPETSDRIYNYRGVTFKMIFVEAGTLQKDTIVRKHHKKPREITISKDYFIGETEVTQDLWKAVMGENLTRSSKSYKNQDYYPAYVDGISGYGDVQQFIYTLNSMTGENFRLPTEKEWEYAARGGNKSKGYEYSGSNSIDDVAWYADNSTGKPRPVKLKTPNELGIYDMSGNVWELCSDKYRGFQTVHNSGHIVCGGSWYNTATRCGCNSRSSDRTGRIKSRIIGFRLALYPKK